MNEIKNPAERPMKSGDFKILKRKSSDKKSCQVLCVYRWEKEATLPHEMM